LFVSVVMPTLNRPVPLRRALHSLTAQHVPDGHRIELVVVDNSPDGNARHSVEAIARETAIPLRYVSEPHPGIAVARNRGVRESVGDWVAFLDDDEEAAPDWVQSLCAAAKRSDADAVFGPVMARPEADRADVGDASVLLGYFERRRELPDGGELTDWYAYLGTNNSMFCKATCLASPQPFEEVLDRIGGEDSLLLLQLYRAGRRFAWARGATVTEWVPPRRLTWSYVRRRKMLSGQIRTFVHRMLVPPQWLQVALWMLVGAAQASVAGAGAAFVWPLDRVLSHRLGVTAFSGLGKLLWFPRFRPSLYGSNLVS
jgi:glycosyltransferase involved in cell wall biosynthesis